MASCVIIRLSPIVLASLMEGHCLEVLWPAEKVLLNSQLEQGSVSRVTVRKVRHESMAMLVTAQMRRFFLTRALQGNRYNIKQR